MRTEIQRWYTWLDEGSKVYQDAQEGDEADKNRAADGSASNSTVDRISGTGVRVGTGGAATKIGYPARPEDGGA